MKVKKLTNFDFAILIPVFHNKDKIKPIVDKTIVHITNTQLTQIENNFHKLRNKNARKKKILTFLRKSHQKFSILHKI